jgi:hypothetical protein
MATKIKQRLASIQDPFHCFCSKTSFAFVLALLVFAAGNCIGAELSLNGIVPAVSEAHGHGWTMGIPAGGFLPGTDVAVYAGYWGPVIPSDIPPSIATNALIFPAAYSALQAMQSYNITWDPALITDDIDGTNLIITCISVHRSNDLSEVGIAVTNMFNGYGWYS